jgi:hypothetical protein
MPMIFLWKEWSKELRNFKVILFFCWSSKYYEKLYNQQQPLFLINKEVDCQKVKKHY